MVHGQGHRETDTLQARPCTIARPLLARKEGEWALYASVGLLHHRKKLQVYTRENTIVGPSLTMTDRKLLVLRKTFVKKHKKAHPTLKPYRSNSQYEHLTNLTN